MMGFHDGKLKTKTPVRFTFLKSTIEALEKGVKYVQS